MILCFYRQKVKIFKEKHKIIDVPFPLCCQNPLVVCLMVRYKSFPVSLWQRLFRSRKKDPNLEDQLELPAFQRDEEIHPQDYIMMMA
jgi:hypothetical protein